MNHYIKARTNGINCYGDGQYQQKLQLMFPLHSVSDDNISQALNKYFNVLDPQHIRYLEQACFKTPLADVAKVYQQFRSNKYPSISQPRISYYFHNQDFVSLTTIQKWLDGLADYPSLDNASNMKQKIAQVLLNISQQFGFIPNLERFLLYYPNYLTKILKFKNRFFEQRDQTGEITYLSPINCCFAGIIAAIEVGSPYMIARMVNMFLVRNGKIEWITQKKYPQQFKPIFGLFRKIAVAPWSINQTDLQFTNTNWDKKVYFDLINAGMFVMSMSTISLAMGLIPDQPCKFIPLNEIIEIKKKYDSQQYEQKQNKIQVVQQIHEMIINNKQFTKQQVAQIQGKQIQPYMKQINIKINTQELHVSINKLFAFLGIDQNYIVNIKNKNNSFFYRSRYIIDNGLNQMKKIDKIQQNKFQCFKNYCIQGANMTFDKQYSEDVDNQKKQINNGKIFKKWIQVMTQNLCGYHNQSFDYKKNIKLNTKLTMPLKFYVRLLSTSPLYIKKQVLTSITNQQNKGWMQCFNIGHLAIMVSQNKAKLLMTCIQL